MRFQGKSSIVTGGASGIGGAIARRLASEGASVLIADINEPAALANVEGIRQAGGTAEAIRTDVAIHEDVRAMVERAVTLWGRLDILVNNAYSPGNGHAGSAEEVSAQQWDEGMAILVKAIFLGVKYSVPEMRAAGGGSIVNISSVHGLLGTPGGLVYQAGKSAVIGITKEMACDFGPDNIRVNAICPGHIVTERSAEYWHGKSSVRPLILEQSPVRRVGKTDDIAAAAAFLCSEEASFITGHALVVDGGLSIQLQEDLGIRQARFSRARADVEVFPERPS